MPFSPTGGGSYQRGHPPLVHLHSALGGVLVRKDWKFPDPVVGADVSWRALRATLGANLIELLRALIYVLM